MKVKFNGIYENKKRHCGVCGKGVSRSGFTTSKMYILPSGRNKTFYVGRIEEVSDADGRFLLSYNGNGRPVFERVE